MNGNSIPFEHFRKLIKLNILQNDRLGYFSGIKINY